MKIVTIIIHIHNKILTLQLPLNIISKICKYVFLLSFSIFFITSLWFLAPVGKRVYYGLDYRIKKFEYYKKVISENNIKLKSLGQMYDIEIHPINVSWLLTYRDLNSALKYQRNLMDYIKDERVSYNIVASHTPTFNPVFGGRIVSGMGYRTDPITNLLAYHEGIDIVTNSNMVYAPIYAPADGEIVRAGPYGGYGNVIIIDHKFGYETRYGHCSVVYVSAGDKVKRGQFIGRIGATGRATGVHLHYELRYKHTLKNPARTLQCKFSP